MPQPIEGELVVESVKLSSPPALGVGMLKVGEGSLIWPDLTNEHLPIELKEDVGVLSIVECFVVLAGSVGNTSVNNGNELHVHAVESVDDGGKLVE